MRDSQAGWKVDQFKQPCSVQALPWWQQEATPNDIGRQWPRAHSTCTGQQSRVSGLPTGIQKQHSGVLLIGPCLPTGHKHHAVSGRSLPFETNKSSKRGPRHLHAIPTQFSQPQSTCGETSSTCHDNTGKRFRQILSHNPSSFRRRSSASQVTCQPSVQPLHPPMHMPRLLARQNKLTERVLVVAKAPASREPRAAAGSRKHLSCQSRWVRKRCLGRLGW